MKLLANPLRSGVLRLKGLKATQSCYIAKLKYNGFSKTLLKFSKTIQKHYQNYS